MEKKRISRKLSRSNSDADILGGGTEGVVKATVEGNLIGNDHKRRSHSIDELLLSGGEGGDMEVSLETASNRIEEILGNDRKPSKSGGRPLLRSLVNLKKKDGSRGKKIQRTSSQCEEEWQGGVATVSTEPLSCDNSPNIKRKKAMMKKVRQSLMLTFNHDNDPETSSVGGGEGSECSGERRSSSPPAPPTGTSANRYTT